MLPLNDARRFSMQRVPWILTRWLLLIVVATRLIDPPIILGRIVDPCPEEPTLRALADRLDALGVDVALGVTSDYEILNRPRIARLDGFRGQTLDWAEISKFDWMSGFSEGLVGALLAVPGKDGPPPALKAKLGECQAEPVEVDREACNFVERWLAEKDPEGRIFLSYTRADWEAAKVVKTALEELGYVVFSYLKGESQATWAHPGLVGEAFAQAGVRYVVDSRNSRGSAGVAFEVHCRAVLALTPVTRTRWSERLREGVQP